MTPSAHTTVLELYGITQSRQLKVWHHSFCAHPFVKFVTARSYGDQHWWRTEREMVPVGQIGQCNAALYVFLTRLMSPQFTQNSITHTRNTQFYNNQVLKCRNVKQSHVWSSYQRDALFRTDKLVRGMRYCLEILQGSRKSEQSICWFCLKYCRIRSIV